MNRTDTSIMYLLGGSRRRGALGALGTNGVTVVSRSGEWAHMSDGTWRHIPTVGAGTVSTQPATTAARTTSGSSAGGIASDIARSVAQMTTGITQAIVQSRQAGAAAEALPAEGVVAEGFGVGAVTPWGRIFIGGAALLAITGLLVYIVAERGHRKYKARRTE